MSSPAPVTDPIPSPAPANSPLPTKPPPPGFKWVRARKPDGTFITAKKRLTPEELEAQKKAEGANPTPIAPRTDAPNANGTPAEDNTPDAAVQYKIITARKPDGTLVKVKRPLKPGEVANTTTTTTTTTTKPAVATPTAPDSATAAKDETATSDAPTAAPEPELSSADKELLREQALANKKHRRGRFGTALLVGLLGVAGSTLPDLMDGDEIMSDTDFDISEDEGEDDDDDSHDPENRTIDSNEPSSASNVAPVAAGVATAAVGAAAAAALAPQPQQPKPADRRLNLDAPQANGDGKGKGDYKVTVKDLKDLDEKAEREANENRLSRRWADFSFYLMASLSVILPLLFLLLAIFIMSMHKKSTETNWGKMIDAIKIAITVWPIVFAAVTAQGFKTWASYKVERGVKLMELEQLVGSSSFGAVMKQPFLLRRLDILTIGIFVIWALSPIGSQALIRSYELKRDEVTASAPVAYVPTLGHNMLLTPNARNAVQDETVLSELWQMVSIYFVGSSMGAGVKASRTPIPQDVYNNPLPVLDYIGHNIPNVLSGFGVPLALPFPKVDSYSGKDPESDEKVQQAAQAESPYEYLDFNVKSSVFQFTCDPWRTEKRSVLDEGPILTWSLSESLGLAFFPDAANITTTDLNTPVTRLRYAGLLDDPKVLNRTGWSADVTINPDWNYGVIDCRWEQVFYNTTVSCSADVKTETNSYDCHMYNSSIIPLDKVRPGWHTPLRDFSAELVVGSTPFPVAFPTTPIERAAIHGSRPDGSPPPSNWLLDDENYVAITPESFAKNFGVLFNSFVALTHCIECYDVPSLAWVRPDLLPADDDYHGTAPSAPPRVVDLYQTPELGDTGVRGPASQVYTPPGMIFVLDWRWVGVLLASVVVLLLIGIASIVLESFLIAPDVLGYASSLVRNSRYLHLPKTAAKPMSGPERARTIGSVSVMIQDVKPDKPVGKIALGLHHDRAEKLKPGRLYR